MPLLKNVQRKLEFLWKEDFAVAAERSIRIVVVPFVVGADHAQFTVVVVAIPLILMMLRMMAIMTTMMTTMIDFISKNWWALIFLALLFYCLFSAWMRSDYRKFADVIVKRWQDADFYYGKQGSEFDYNGKNSTWSQIVKRDAWTCYRCKRKVFSQDVAEKKILGMKFRVPGRRKVNVDHIVPYIYGGQGTLENGRAACYKCNIRRSAKIDRDCLKKVRELGKKIYIGRKVPKFKYERNRR